MTPTVQAILEGIAEPLRELVRTEVTQAVAARLREFDARVVVLETRHLDERLLKLEAPRTEP